MECSGSGERDKKCGKDLILYVEEKLERLGNPKPLFVASRTDREGSFSGRCRLPGTGYALTHVKRQRMKTTTVRDTMKKWRTSSVRRKLNGKGHMAKPYDQKTKLVKKGGRMSIHNLVNKLDSLLRIFIINILSQIIFHRHSVAS